MQVPHKGIGSGIVRILAEYPEIRLENDVYVFSEEEKGLMLKGVEIIDSLSEEKTFISDDVKLRYVATLLPGVFSEGTKYACNEK